MEISTCWLFIVGKKSCETDFSAFSKKPRQGSSIKALAPIRRLLPPSQFKVRHSKLTAASCLFGLTVCVNNNYWMKQSLSVLTQATNEKCAALLQSPLCKNTGSGFPLQLHDTTCYSQLLPESEWPLWPAAELTLQLHPHCTRSLHGLSVGPGTLSLDCDGDAPFCSSLPSAHVDRLCVPLEGSCGMNGM